MKNRVLNFNKILKENLESDYARVDEVVDAYLDLRDVAEEELIAKLNGIPDEVPVLNENVGRARMLVVELLVAKGYNPDTYLRAAEQRRFFSKKFRKTA